MTMPELPDAASEATVFRWFKQEGDTFKQHEPLVELVTSRLDVELRAPSAGRLTSIVVAAGATARGGQPLAMLEPLTAMSGDEHGERLLSQRPRRVAGRAEMRARATPALRRLAEQYGLDVDGIEGTGLGGRIRAEDIEAARATSHEGPRGETGRDGRKEDRGAGEAPQVIGSLVHPLPLSSRLPSSPLVDRLLPLTVRRAERAATFTRAEREAPHTYSVVPVDMRAAVTWLRANGFGGRHTPGDNAVLALVLKAVAASLRGVPVLNGVLEGRDAHLRARIHIGVQRLLTDGTVALAVVPDADTLDVLAMRDVLDAADLRISLGWAPEVPVTPTFTVAHPGRHGTLLSYLIMEPDQSALLSVDALIPRPVALGDTMEVHPMMNLSLCFDHRITDGAVAGGFTARVRDWLQALDRS